jgi:cobalt/nickel transport system permease protein
VPGGLVANFWQKQPGGDSVHIPDGFLSAPVAGSLWLAAAGANAWALQRLQRELDEAELPTLGVLAAGVFAAQALNVPVLGGTSGHLVGTALLVALLGPHAAVVVLTAVLTVQALVFQDGGLLALGANVVNMGVVAAFVAHGVLATARRVLPGARGQAAAVFLAAWCATVAGALATALELAASGTSPASLVVPAMGGVHAAVGVLEGVLTVAAWRLVTTVRPRLAAAPHTGPGPTVLGLAVAAALALLAPWASSDPDGLERVAIDLGFHSFARPPWFRVLEDYRLPVLPDPWSTAVAVFVGAVVAFSVVRWVGRALVARRVV